LKYEEAEGELKKAISIDKNFLEAYMLLGDVYRTTQKYAEAVRVYGSVADKDVDKYPEALYFSGLSYFELADYSRALTRFKKFLRYESSGGRAEDAEFLKSCCIFSIDAMNNPVPFEPVNLGEGINSSNHEYINSVSSDELQLYFTRRQLNDKAVAKGEDFYFSSRVSNTDKWKPAIKLKPPINSSHDEGALFIAPDGRFLLFAGCHRPEGYGSCDIYAVKILGDKTSDPINLGPVINTNAWETQPSLSSDGRSLFFVSNRAGGKGQSDIWMSRLQDNGEWTNPENLGEEINTQKSEMAPYIHPDGQTFYFSSDGHVGMGGMDLFVSRIDSAGNWSGPLNLGYTVNTPSDEINIIVNAWGDKGYISSNQHDGQGGYDIFEFELTGAAKPVASTFMKGIVKDKMTKQPLEAYFSLIDLTSGNEIVRSFSDPVNGGFLVCIPTDKEYALNVSAAGYLFFSENYALAGLSSEVEPFFVDVELSPIQKGETMTLRNIFFETDGYQLEPSSFTELNKLIEFLNYNPGLKIEIGGHADGTGDAKYNLDLSAKRAQSVFDYLVQHGVDARHLVHKGYGLSMPVAGNDTEAGRAKNRRTEIIILENIVD
jgi:flagellar motor protein MotB